MQRAYLCVIIHVNQLPFLAVLTWFLILGKIQDGGQDGHHYWWRHRPPAAPPFIRYTSSCWEDQRLFSEGKIASKYCSIPKALGRGPWPPPPSRLFFDQNEVWRAEKSFFGDRAPLYPPLVPWWGIWFCVYVRGSSGSLKLWQGSGWFCMRLQIFIKTSFIIDTKGLYCVTKGNISFSSLSFCFRSAAFLLRVLLLIAIFLSKLCG